MRIFCGLFLILILNETTGISQILEPDEKLTGEKGIYCIKESKGVSHLFSILNDSVFTFTYFPKNWNCWSLSGYNGKYFIASDTITFIFDSTNTLVLSQTKEVFRIKSNGNIRKLSGSPTYSPIIDTEKKEKGPYN